MSGTHPDSRQQRGTAGVVALVFLAVVVVVAGLLATYQFVDPAPPRKVVLATGAAGGAYQLFGEAYAARLADAGIEVELRESSGAAQNLEWLREDTGVDIAFVQSGLAPDEDDGKVSAIASLYLEPMWLFVRRDYAFVTLPDLEGARIAVGESGSGTRVVAGRLLEAHGVRGANTRLLATPPMELAESLAAGIIDAAFVVGAPLSETVASLVHTAEARLVSLDRATAYARRNPYLKSVTIPAGVFDLEADLPPEDVHTVSTTAMLVSRRDLHPALVDLLLVTAADIHGGHGLLADRGTFPSPQYVDFPLSREAERHFRRGPPFLMRYLPFWAATFIDRMWVMLLPLIGLAIPLSKLIPPAYEWQIRRRFLKLYAELESLDPNVSPIADGDDLDRRKKRIDWLEGQAAATHVPKKSKDAMYKLRRDIDLVRRQLRAAPGVAGGRD